MLLLDLENMLTIGLKYVYLDDFFPALYGVKTLKASLPSKYCDQKWKINKT